MDLRERRELTNGFGDGLARAFEMAVTPLVFGVLGYALDAWLGLVPLLTIVFVVFALAGSIVIAWYRYDDQMKRQEAAGSWSRPPRAPAPQGTESAA